MNSNVNLLQRRFKYNSLDLEDPDPDMSLEEVREFYANIYPELTQAVIEGPELTSTAEVYTFKKIAGTKGITIGEILLEDIEGRPVIEIDTGEIARLKPFMQKTSSILLSKNGEYPISLPSESLGMI